MQPKGKTGRADIALNLINKLYGIEREECSDEQRYEARQHNGLPVLANCMSGWRKHSLKSLRKIRWVRRSVIWPVTGTSWCAIAKPDFYPLATTRPSVRLDHS